MMRTSEPLPPTTLSAPGPSNVNGLRQPLAARNANRSAHCHPIATLISGERRGLIALQVAAHDQREVAAAQLAVFDQIFRNPFDLVLVIAEQFTSERASLLANLFAAFV